MLLTRSAMRSTSPALLFSYVIFLVFRAGKMGAEAQDRFAARSIRFSPKLLLGRADYQYNDEGGTDGGGEDDVQGDDKAAHSRQKR